MLRMSPNSVKDEFVNVNNLIRKIQDIFKCQICFKIKGEESTFFYWKCQHFFCTDCVKKNDSCVICSETNEHGGREKQIKLSENENILEIFRVVAGYDSLFLPIALEESECNLQLKVKSAAPKKLENKNRTVMVVGKKIDTKNDSQKKKGMNVFKRNYKGETPLHLACRKADITLMRELIDVGANPNMQDNAGWTPLHDAVAFQRKDVIQFLLDNGARVNTPGHENTTALHQAVTNRNCEILRLLLNYGADKKARNIYGETPVDLVKKYNFIELEEIMMTTAVSLKSQLRILDTSFIQESATVLFGFNLNESESSLLKNFANKFKYKTTEKLSLQLSSVHIITSDGEPKITWNIIPGVLMACRVINIKWMKDSLAMKSVRSIEEYEEKGELYAGFAKSQRNRIDQLPGLFSGCHFYFGGNFELYKTKNSSFLKTELKLLVEKNGGVILSRNPDPESLALEKTIPYHAEVSSSLSETSYYIIYSKELWDPAPKYNMSHMKTLPVEWLLASIYKFQLIDPKTDQSYMDYI